MKKKVIIIILIILAAVLTVLLIMYFQGKEYYSSHFKPNTVIDGQDVSGMDTEEYLSTCRDRYPDTFTITERSGSTLTFSIEDAVTNHDIEDFVGKEQNDTDTWFTSWFEDTGFTPGTKLQIDEKVLRGSFDQALKEGDAKRTQPEDAYFDKEKMEIVPEVEGNSLNVEQVFEHVADALDRNLTSVTLTDDDYLAPEIRADDPSLTSLIEERDSFIHAVKVKVAGTVSKKIKKKTVGSWLYYDEDHFDFDKEAVNAYVQKLADKYNTAYTERNFTTTPGYDIIVGNGPEDNYGGYILNEEETAASLYQTLMDKGEKMECSWDMTGYTMDENGDIGGTYIEISIPDQHMWIYRDHELAIETDVITGLPSDPSRATPTGLFCVMEMRSPYVMHGSYGSQPCSFFIRVTGYGVAIHDANWQSSFGGDAYRYRGSHGCINTPYDKVSELWDLLSSLDNYQVPIIIY